MINCLNVFPSKNGIPSNLIPSAIILGSTNPDYNKLKITFVAYAQVYIGNTNSKKQKTVRVAVLRSEHERGGYYFMSLSNIKQIHAFILT